jgi:hypothetical protein
MFGTTFIFERAAKSRAISQAVAIAKTSFQGIRILAYA